MGRGACCPRNYDGEEPISRSAESGSFRVMKANFQPFSPGARQQYLLGLRCVSRAVDLGGGSEEIGRSDILDSCE
jgi:hypothetical protein